jgi:hypothetical protein
MSNPVLWGDDNPSWKGDNVKYCSLHQWLVRKKGKPSKCEHCGTTDIRRYQWANIDHKYRRNVDDFIRLCIPCHKKYDYGTGLAKKGGNKNPIKYWLGKKRSKETIDKMRKTMIEKNKYIIRDGKGRFKKNTYSDDIKNLCSQDQQTAGYCDTVKK